jgi:oxygen-independent coproporphyrinogen-3 oxidase
MPSKHLLLKYSYPAPRYTGYPPVPLWELSGFDLQKWRDDFSNLGLKTGMESQLYIHLPYCENLCTFCACNKRITKNHSVELPYIEAVLKEWQMYVDLAGGPIKLSEIHLGGGTPTFFSPESLSRLMEGIFQISPKIHLPEMAIEIHPGFTTKEQLKTLANLGFKRLSIGIQDFTPFILEKINRKQSYAQTKELVEEARKQGFDSLNFDLVYGLPFQKAENITDTIEKVLSLGPDRIAFYGYAHVPWKSKGQRHFTEEDLPKTLERWKLFETGEAKLLAAGFVAVGMDHFAKENDGLARAQKESRLHRNFMGYTDQNAKYLIGLGASAISETPNFFAQNHPDIESYLAYIENNTLPILKAHSLSQADKFWKTKILDLICKGITSQEGVDQDSLNRLKEMEAEGLLSLEKGNIQILPEGKAFIRNICQMLDQRYWAGQSENALFSAAV